MLVFYVFSRPTKVHIIFENKARIGRKYKDLLFLEIKEFLTQTGG